MSGEEEIQEIPRIGIYRGERNEQFERHGKGVNQFPNGDVFDGIYNIGKREGDGVYKWKATKARYTGGYKDNKRHGTGTLVYPDGSKYFGEFADGVKSGHGVYTYVNGDEFDGEWENDLKHGSGVYTFKGLNVTKHGTWNAGVLTGESHVRFPNSIVTGIFSDNNTVQGKKMSGIDINSSGGILDYAKHPSKSIPQPLSIQKTLSKSESINSASVHENNTYLQAISNTKTVIRSKSSFSLDGLVATPPSNESVERLKKRSPTEDKFFKDLDSSGFSGMWNHPMTRCYFLMYLLSKNFSNLFFFRMDVMQYRNDCKRQTAIRIYHLYLSKHALLPLRFTDDTNVRHFVAKIKGDMEQPHPSPSIFDDIIYVVHINLRYLYSGGDESAMNTPSLPVTKCIDFKESVFYQMMLNDLRGKWKPNTDQYIKAIERLLDMPKQYFRNEDLWMKLEDYALSLGADLDIIKNIIEAAKKDIPLKNSSNQINLKSISSLESKNDDEKEASSPGTKPKGGNFMTQGTFQNAEHTFVQHHSVTSSKYCESCLDEAGSTEATSIYRCAVCGYVCHKACRKEVRVSCTKIIDGNNDDENKKDVKLTNDKVEQLEKKIKSIQTEVNIEARILDGLLKMGQAKNDIKDAKAKKRLTLQEPDMHEQIEKSRKKLELFRNEIIKCQEQIEIFKSDEKAEQERLFPFKASESAVFKYELSKQFNDIIEAKLPLHVSNPDKTMAIYNLTVNFDMTAQEWIQIACDTLNYPITSGYVITYVNPENEEIFLDQSIPLKEYQINLNSSKLCLKLAKEVQINIIDYEKQKIRTLEVLNELIETEVRYASDLSSIIDVFYTPLLSAGLISLENLNAIFSNIEEIIKIHTPIVKALNETLPSDIIGVIRCFSNSIHGLTAYYQYCGNQHSARRMLNEVKSDPSTLRDIQKREQNPSLNKLTLSDLLVKPMHRITRYPLLFKRLLSHLTVDSEEYKIMVEVVASVEEKISHVNEIVRVNEATHRIKLMDENMDFGSLEKFKLCNGRRELVSERNMTYHKKGTREPIDVTLILFNDMVLIAKLKKMDQYFLMKPPIPLEEAVFLDKPDTSPMKNIFQIIHLQQEIYTLQTRSKTDKSVWLVEAEDQRLLFCLSYIEYEGNILKDKADRYQMESFLDDDECPSPLGTLKRTATLNTNRHGDDSKNKSIFNTSSASVTGSMRTSSVSSKGEKGKKNTVKKREESTEKFNGIQNATLEELFVSTTNGERRYYPNSISTENVNLSGSADDSGDADTRSLSGSHSRVGTSASMKDRMKRSLLSAGASSGLTTWLRKKKPTTPGSDSFDDHAGKSRECTQGSMISNHTAPGGHELSPIKNSIDD